MRIFQRLCLLGYEWLRRTGVPSTPLGRAFTGRLYDIYKWLSEGRKRRILGTLIREGDVVVDVGANVGFFTMTFADRVGERGKVLAIEPEPGNFGRLTARLGNAGLAGRVIAIEAAAAEAAGEARLEINPQNPADHRLGEHGILVATVSLDDEIEKANSGRVSLIKIDVQGAEPRVIAGARRTIAMHRPVLVLEVDIATSDDAGQGIAEVLSFLSAQGYLGYRISRRPAPPLSISAILTEARRRGYEDFMFSAYPELHPGSFRTSCVSGAGGDVTS